VIKYEWILKLSKFLLYNIKEGGRLTNKHKSIHISYERQIHSSWAIRDLRYGRKQGKERKKERKIDWLGASPAVDLDWLKRPIYSFDYGMKAIY
jgi:hypothetical protein